MDFTQLKNAKTKYCLFLYSKGFICSNNFNVMTFCKIYKGLM